MQAIELAYEMGLRQSRNAVIAVLRLPASAYDELANAGYIRTGQVPGVEIPETVFLPPGFDRINDEGCWPQIVDPKGL
jgi:hypothetical protein